MEDGTFSIIRFVEIACIGLFVFGLIWNTSEILKLTVPQFMMLYGGVGAGVCESIIRWSKKKTRN